MTVARRPTVLIVDDQPTNIRVLGAAIASEYQIIVATSGEEALELMARQPDIVLLDILMPGMDGYEVCRRLKAEPTTAHIPVIFISAMSAEEDEALGLQLGAVDYISKPFSTAIVKARVRTHIELKRHRDVLQQLSMRDGLTGVPNRRRFDEHFEVSWRVCVREQSPLSLAMIDIDHFKAFNDLYGHQAGDDCLMQVARTLEAQAARPLDLLARYGGEEFSCLLPATDRQGATSVAERMRREVERLRIAHAGSSAAPHVTVSVGTATAVPHAGLSPAGLLAAADRGLYEAKTTSRNRVVCYEFSGNAPAPDRHG